MHRDQALSFKVSRQNLRNKMKLSSLINWTITSILFICCLTEIISIFDFYLSYPTNIFIETKFQSHSKILPAISFCTNIGDHSGYFIEDIFRDNNISDYISDIGIFGPGYINLESIQVRSRFLRNRCHQR